MLNYFLSAIYNDNKTDLGTWAREIHHKNLKRALANFKKNYKGKAHWNMKDRYIIGVEIECCKNGYDSLTIERIIF